MRRATECAPAAGRRLAFARCCAAFMRGDHAVIGNATGCLEVSSYMYPYSAWEDSYIHNAFENAGATLSGVETAYKVLKKREDLVKRTRSSSLPSAATAAPMISGSSPCPVLWNVDTIWSMCAMIMVPI